MSERVDRDFLSDIREAARRVGAYTAAMTYDAFLADIRTQDAVIRNLEIIGEAAKNLSAGLQAKYPDIPWKAMAGVRDRLIHQYFGVNYDIVWQIITGELPVVESQVEGIQRHEENSGAS